MRIYVFLYMCYAYVPFITVQPTETAVIRIPPYPKWRTEAWRFYVKAEKPAAAAWVLNSKSPVSGLSACKGSKAAAAYTDAYRTQLRVRFFRHDPLRKTTGKYAVFTENPEFFHTNKMNGASGEDEPFACTFFAGVLSLTVLFVADRTTFYAEVYDGSRRCAISACDVPAWRRTIWC